MLANGSCCLKRRIGSRTQHNNRMNDTQNNPIEEENKYQVKELVL